MMSPKRKRQNLSQQPTRASFLSGKFIHQGKQKGHLLSNIKRDERLGGKGSKHGPRAGRIAIHIEFRRGGYIATHGDTSTNNDDPANQVRCLWVPLQGLGHIGKRSETKDRDFIRRRANFVTNQLVRRMLLMKPSDFETRVSQSILPVERRAINRRN